jgi:multidrug efflux pump subunit AcrA (membrane-fusion protein)
MKFSRQLDGSLLLAFALTTVLAASPSHSAPPLAVEVLVAEETQDTVINTLTGEIVARDTLTAAFSTSGRIETVPVDQGDKVKRAIHWPRRYLVNASRQLPRQSCHSCWWKSR